MLTLKGPPFNDIGVSLDTIRRALRQLPIDRLNRLATRMTTAAAPARFSIDVRRLPWFRRLATDYAYAFDALAPFYAGNPAEPGAWREAIDRATAHPRPRPALAETLVAQQRRFGAPPAAVAAAARLADPRAVAVVTGQQAGLFGGPLFTLLKALTAVTRAAEVERRFQAPAVPVFWIEAEDHDWDEVASASVLDGDVEPRRVTLPSPPGAGTLPVARVALGDQAAAAIDGLAASLPQTEFTAVLLDALRAAYRPGASLPEGFARWMLHVLGERGLVVYDASDPAMKRLAAPVFAQEIRNAGRTSVLANQAGHDLATRGYHAQVEAGDDALALFLIDGARTPVRPDADGFVVGETRRSAADLLALVEATPWTFSPNVLLRPIVQDTIFPTVAYVAGPNELAYLGQLRGVYAGFGVPMPLMVPRASATLLDSASMKFLAKTGLMLESLGQRDEAALNRLLEQHLPAGVERAWQEADEHVSTRMQALIKAVPAIDPTLEGAARSALGRMKHDLDTLHAKLVQAAKRRDDTLRRQFAHTQALAFPGGDPQERAIGFVSFLNRYGPALVDRLLTELPWDDAGHHWVLTM
jgi:bacillithiol biosynthesis cysteine-adding enzyme BshC